MSEDSGSLLPVKPEPKFTETVENKGEFIYRSNEFRRFFNSNIGTFLDKLSNRASRVLTRSDVADSKGAIVETENGVRVQLKKEGLFNPSWSLKIGKQENGAWHETLIKFKGGWQKPKIYEARTEFRTHRDEPKPLLYANISVGKNPNFEVGNDSPSEGRPRTPKDDKLKQFFEKFISSSNRIGTYGFFKVGLGENVILQVKSIYVMSGDSISQSTFEHNPSSGVFERTLNNQLDSLKYFNLSTDTVLKTEEVKDLLKPGLDLFMFKGEDQVKITETRSQSSNDDLDPQLV